MNKNAFRANIVPTLEKKFRKNYPVDNNKIIQFDQTGGIKDRRGRMIPLKSGPRDGCLIGNGVIDFVYTSNDLMNMSKNKRMNEEVVDPVSWAIT